MKRRILSRFIFENKLVATVCMSFAFSLNLGGCNKLFDLEEVKLKPEANYYSCELNCRKGGQTIALKGLDVCFPPEWNVNLPNGDANQIDLKSDCENRVWDKYEEITGTVLGNNYECPFSSSTNFKPTNWDQSCDEVCNDPSGVCLVANSDPPEPTPTPLSEALFKPTSICKFPGEFGNDEINEAVVIVGDESISTALNGVVYVHGGKLCQSGQACQVGVSFYAFPDDIEFENFWGKKRLSRLGMSGSTELPPSANSIYLTPLSTLYAGDISSELLLSSVRGFIDGGYVAQVGRNDAPITFAIDWANKFCLIDGEFLRNVEGEDGDVSIIATIQGTLVNQPPIAKAGSDQTIECTSPEGAAVTLDGSASTDGDGNIIAYGWRLGGQDGDFVADPSETPKVDLIQGLGMQHYHLNVSDSYLSSGADESSVTVVDTTPPEINCGTPATIYPNDAPIAFAATAQDLCGSVSNISISHYECFQEKQNGKIINKDESCVITTSGNVLNVLDVGGVSTKIRWWPSASDNLGNQVSKSCEIVVARPKS